MGHPQDRPSSLPSIKKSMYAEVWREIAVRRSVALALAGCYTETP